MNNIHCIPVGNGEPPHECHTLCWCHPAKDPESVNLYVHNAKDCREKWERQGLEMPPESLWVIVEEKLNVKMQQPPSRNPNAMSLPDTHPKPDDVEQPSPEGLAAMPCSELVVPAAIEAINGYLKNRYLLCEQLAEISSTYEREKDRRKCIENQIDIIDRCVIAVLHAQNVSDQATARSGL